MFATEDKHRRHLDITYSRKFYMVHTVSQWTHKHRNFARKLRRLVNIEVKMVNGSRYYRALESVVSIASTLSTALTIYPSPSNADSLKLNFLQLRRRSGGRPQRTVHPRRLPVNTVIHTTVVGLEPATFRLLVRRATSMPPRPQNDNESICGEHTGERGDRRRRWRELWDPWAERRIGQQQSLYLTTTASQHHSDVQFVTNTKHCYRPRLSSHEVLNLTTI